MSRHHYTAEYSHHYAHPPMPNGANSPQGRSQGQPQRRVPPSSYAAYPDPYPDVEGGRYAVPHPQVARPRRRSRPRRRQMWLAGSGVGMLAVAALVVSPRPGVESQRAATVCEQRVQSTAVLSRDQLSKLLSIPERSSREAVREVIDQPYCLLANVAVREGTPSEREAYPLEFDPQTWLIVLYEGEEYVGYDFSFRRD